MSTIRALAPKAAFLLAALAGACTFVTMLIICGDVTLRFFGGSIPGTFEIVANYLMVMVAYLPIAQIERRDQMISVDSFYTISPRAAKLAMAALVAIGLTATYATVAYVTWFDALANFRKGAFVYTLTYTMPIWPAYFIAPIAFALGAVVTALRLVDIVGHGELPEESPEAGGGMSDEVDIKAGMV